MEASAAGTNWEYPCSAMDAPPNTSAANVYWELSYVVTRLFSEATDQSAPIAAIMALLGSRLDWDLVTFWKLDEGRRMLVCLDVWQAPSRPCEEFAQASCAR